MGEKKPIRILVLVVAVLYFLVFLGYIFPNLGRATVGDCFLDFVVYFIGVVAISVSVYTFVFQLGSEHNGSWAIFSAFCLALSIILPIGHCYQKSRQNKAVQLMREWDRTKGHNVYFYRQPWVRATEGDLKQTAIYMRMLTKDVDKANEWLERIKNEKISNESRKKLRQNILTTKLAKIAYRKELCEKFLSVSRTWIRELMDGVEHSPKEERDEARWKIAGVFQEIDKNALGNLDAEILLLYQRAQRKLGNLRTLQFEKFK